MKYLKSRAKRGKTIKDICGNCIYARRVVKLGDETFVTCQNPYQRSPILLCALRDYETRLFDKSRCPIERSY